MKARIDDVSDVARQREEHRTEREREVPGQAWSLQPIHHLAEARASIY
jgi:hypothetical protein